MVIYLGKKMIGIVTLLTFARQHPYKALFISFTYALAIPMLPV